MTRIVRRTITGLLAGAVLMAGPAQAHITPPVVLMSDRDALVRLLAGAQKFYVREVRLSPAEREAIKRETGWSPDEDFYRFYLGRDAQGRLAGAATFVTEYTVHGPVRVAVGFGPDGKLKGAMVIEVTEETYAWVKPLLDQDFVRDYLGRDGHGRFGLSSRLASASAGAMPHFYGEVLASLLQRAALLFEVGVLKRGDAA